jgi:hypothetical protein
MKKIALSLSIFGLSILTGCWGGKKPVVVKKEVIEKEEVVVKTPTQPQQKRISGPLAEKEAGWQEEDFK